MKRIISRIGTGLVFALFIFFFGLKGCIKRVVHFDQTAVYQQIYSTGESNTVYVVPGNTLIVKKQFQDQFEYGVFKVRGDNATHYFGSLYNRGETLLGIRMYSGATDVWKVEMELVEKKSNLDESTFEDIGKKFRNLIVFRDNSVQIGEDIYEKINTTPTDEDFIINTTSGL
jgi:hypothetical protein